MPDSGTRAQKGSNSGRKGERVPRWPATGAGRISTTFAPRSSSQSSSAMPRSGMDGLMMGVAKIRLWLDPDVVEELLTELLGSVDVFDLGDGDSRLMHLHDQNAQSPMLRDIPVGASHAQRVVRLPGVSAPDLRAVQDEFVTVEFCAGERPGQVGAAGRLGQKLDPQFLATAMSCPWRAAPSRRITWWLEYVGRLGISGRGRPSVPVGPAYRPGSCPAA